MKKVAMLIVACFGVVLVIASPGLAQMESVGGIQGRGYAIIELKPERMRMKVDVRASGKDFADAIKKLATQRAEVETQLTEFGAIKGSVKFGDPEVDDGRGSRLQRTLMRSNRRWRSDARMAGQPGRKTDKRELLTPTNLKCSLLAEWQMPSGDAAELLAESQEIKDAVKGIDFGKSIDSNERTPKLGNDDEDDGEMDELSFDEDDGQQQREEPLFVFVARLTLADREKALADAVRAARGAAVELARAAEVELGRLSNLETNASRVMQENEGYFERNLMSYLVHEVSSTEFQPQRDDIFRPNEVIGLRATTIIHRFFAAATFSIK